VVASFAYAAYGTEVGKGLGGWAEDVIFQASGVLAPRAATLLVFAVLAAAGLFLIGALPGQRPLPREVERPWPLWPFFLAIALAGAAFPYFLHQRLAERDAADQRRPIVDVDLSSPAPLPPDTKFVRITGYRPLETSFEVTSSINTQLKTSHTTFAIVPRASSGQESVAWFFEGALPQSFDPPDEDAAESDPEVPLYGELTRNGMPRFLESAFAKAGLRLADPYFRVEQVELEAGHVASRMGQYEMLPWFGFATGPLALALAGLAWLVIRRTPEAASEKGAQPA
jgi:hypothetical protein